MPKLCRCGHAANAHNIDRLCVIKMCPCSRYSTPPDDPITMWEWLAFFMAMMYLALVPVLGLPACLGGVATFVYIRWILR